MLGQAGEQGGRHCEQFRHSLRTRWQSEGLPELSSGAYTATGIQHPSFPQCSTAPGDRKITLSRKIHKTNWAEPLEAV